mmetsp:Transcript_102088/g.284215  ORF Transcript_102088/g.284215 Transcript_102088/m.284215 type:complete len:429 (+) Transcript_102088:140-1426(+)
MVTSARQGSARTYGYAHKEDAYAYSAVSKAETTGDTGAPPLLPEAVDNARTLEPTPPSSQNQTFCARELQGLVHVFCKALNLLIVFVPLGIVAHYEEWNAALIFAFNFIAIVPLAGILGAATESLAVHTGQMVGGLLNATFGNAVELIVTINAIRANLIGVVQGSLMGSVLSNLLLVLGMAFFAAGCVTKESTFSARGACANMNCLTLGSMALALPTIYSTLPDSSPENTLMISRLCSLIIAAVYLLFLVFQLYTHADIFMSEDAEEEEEAALSVGSSGVLLLAATFAVAYCSDFLVDSIEEVSETYGLPKAFIGVILLPIVGNAAEHATAVTVAAKGKMDLSIGVAIGSSTQIALFVVPFSVIVGWICDVDMSLDFRIFDAAVMLLSVLFAASTLHDGTSNWLEGAMLVATYVMIAIICWFIPENQA